MSDHQSESARIAALLVDHWPHPVFGCDCTPVDDKTGVKGSLPIPWEQHVAELICPPGQTSEQP